MEWNEQYSVSIEEIDNQHKIIIDLINKVDAAAQNHKELEQLPAILQELIDYTRIHFAVEESLMRIFNYPDYEPHKKKHDDLVHKVLKFQEQFARGNTLVIKELHYFLQDWLFSHIKGTDKEYTPFMNECGVK